MMPPPPPPRQTHHKAPPPPPPRTGMPIPPEQPDAAPPPISPDLTRFDLEYAVWTFGGYPQTPWPVALRVLLGRCKRETCFPNVCAAAIWMLERKIHPETDKLTAAKIMADIRNGNF